MESINKLNVQSIFHNGKLFQIGDFITSKIGYLDTIGSQRFDQYSESGVIKHIEIYIDTVFNSLYLNHSFTYNGITELSYRFVLENDIKVYAFESNLISLSNKILDKQKFLNDYYNNLINYDKRKFIVEHFNIPNNIKNIGTFLYKNHKKEFEFIYLGFKIRYGYFGLVDENNLSEIMFKTFNKMGYHVNLTKSFEYGLTCKSFYKSNL